MERKVMINLENNNLDYFVGDPENSDIELYMAMPEEGEDFTTKEYPNIVFSLMYIKLLIWKDSSILKIVMNIFSSDKFSVLWISIGEINIFSLIILNTFSKDPLELQQIIILFFLELIWKNFLIKLKSISFLIDEILFTFFMLE